MTILLLGAVTLLGARRMMKRPGRGPNGSFWVLAMGVLVTGQIWVARDRLASYQVRLLGQRFQVGAANEGPARPRTISGDRDAADLHVPGIGDEPVAVLEVDTAGDGEPSVFVTAAGGSLGVVAVRAPRGWGGARWEVLRSVALEPGDRITVRREGVEAELAFARRRVPVLGWLGVTGTVDEVVVRAGGGEGGIAGGEARVEVPYPEGAGVMGLFPRRPSVFQRTYPLGDLLAGVGDGGVGAAAGVRSFLYYDRGRAGVVVLDDGVEVVSAGGVVKEAVTRVGVGAGRRFSVAGLPYRDFPEPRLAEVERYGIRPLRGYRARVDGRWLTLQGPRPEIHAVELSALPAGRGIERGADGDDLHPFRVSVGDAAGTGAEISLSSPANGFAAAAQAVVRLPDASAAGWFELLTPSGLARWETGRPFTLSDGDRGLLLRVDGLGVSAGFLLLLAVLFLIAALPFTLLEASGAARAVALAALGLASLRLLASLSAKARFPFVDEGHQISLWLIPAIPWLVCLAGRIAHGNPTPTTGVALTPRGFSGGFMGAVPDRPSPLATSLQRLRGSAHLAPAVTVALGAALAVLALALFPDSRAKAGVLCAVVLLVTSVRLGPVRGTATTLSRRLRGSRPGLRLRGLPPTRRIEQTLRGHLPTPWTGVLLGALLFLGRVLLDIAGFREQLTLGGTRLGLSVLYTPAALVCLALLVAGHHRRVTSAVPGLVPAAVATAWLDLAGFLTLAYVATSVRISDFGILLTTLPGPLIVLAWTGWRWSRRVGPGAALLGTLPAFLFVALQFAPDLARPGMSDRVAAASRLEDWSRNELLLLERGDPDALRLIGESRSEALGVMRETMRSYTRGNWTGRGFLAGSVSPQIRGTAPREHMVTGLLASQWGLLGTLGLAGMLMAVFVPIVPPRRRLGSRAPASAAVPRPAAAMAVAAVFVLVAAVGLPSPANAVVVGTLVVLGLAVTLIPVVAGSASCVVPDGLKAWLWSPGVSTAASEAREEFLPPADPWTNPLRVLSVAALVSFAAAGAYMILANYGLVLFTGKNVYLLGLDSLGDTLEGLALIAMGVGAWTSAREMDAAQ
ncbi:MAG: hypothetical protein OXQ94_07200 [Gemmatimonadota bacterium]|nr:hypothetical protein [Gemmatimonadota bacterium]MDE2871462.1 hypothetical protein [Gemmatimonadota bacterium]